MLHATFSEIIGSDIVNSYLSFSSRIEQCLHCSTSKDLFFYNAKSPIYNQCTCTEHIRILFICILPLQNLNDSCLSSLCTYSVILYYVLFLCMVFYYLLRFIEINICVLCTFGFILFS